MAKNNKYNKRLVTDDEPTTELQALTPEAADGNVGDNSCPEPVEISSDLSAGELSTTSGQAAADERFSPGEALEKALTTDQIGDFTASADPDANRLTSSEMLSLLDELQSELASRTETIDRLMYANEQFAGKQKGLEAELKARQDIVEQLHRDSRSRADQLAAQRDILKTRDQYIEQLENELRHLTRANGKLLKKTRLLEQEYRSLRNDRGERIAQIAGSVSPIGIIGNQAAEIAELRAKLRGADDYASRLRAVLVNRDSLPDEPGRNRAQLRTSLAVSAEKLSVLEAELQKDHESSSRLRQRLAEVQKSRALEIKAMQLKLDETQEALAEAESAAQELASDLLETRDYRDHLSIKLKQTEDHTRARIDKLELDNSRLISDLTHCQEKLDARGRAINDLLAELAKKSQQHDAVTSGEDALGEKTQRGPDRMTQAFPGEKERCTRLLVGTVDGQEIRFPLFKNRLTIGRSAQNDIQLKATFVSRRHAVLVTDQDKARIVDWGSRNGVYVNSDRISEHFLENNDVITIGVVNFRYEERPKREG